MAVATVTKQRVLTPVQQQKVWDHVCWKWNFDYTDVSPDDVIKNSYGGNKLRWLHDMAKWHRKELQKLPEFQGYFES